MPEPGQRQSSWRADGDERPIADYAFLGDCHGSALVGSDGSIDWCCLDRFDADPVLSRLLDRRIGGYFRIAPDADATVSRRYIPETNILETTFTTSEGRLRVTDFMPVRNLRAGDCSDWMDQEAPRCLVRIAECLEGSLVLKAACRPLAGFAKEPARIRCEAGLVIADGCPPLSADTGFAVDEGVAVARCRLEAGDKRFFVLGRTAPAPARLRRICEEWREQTLRFWTGWVACLSYDGPYRDAVVRSCIVLKSLTYAPSGALIAAPTTSLPEEIGGVRNWDYRFCWLRDACFALYALRKVGLFGTTEAFFDYLLRVTRETRPRLLPLYGLEGRLDIRETEISHFSGYRGSKPVRVGNEAMDQHQLDVYGQILDLMYSHAHLGGELDREACESGIEFADYVAERWREPDSGLWEPRIPERRYMHSAIMAWTALDRAIRLFGERDAWREARDDLLADIRNNGVHPEEGYLPQAFGHADVDAAVLVAPMVDCPVGDEVLSRTVEKVIATLGRGPLVYRYNNEDGLPGEEGTFLVCAFWLIDALLALDRADEARERFEELLALSNDLGLYSEEMAEDGTFLGNFPQAFTHLGLLQSALILDLHRTHGVEGVRGTYADRALRDTRARSISAPES